MEAEVNASVQQMPYCKICVKKNPKPNKNKKTNPNNQQPTIKKPTNSLKLKYRIIPSQVQYGSGELLGKNLCESSMRSEVAFAKRLVPVR